ncbi:hypothetical protein V6N13_112535 [Hibiscus sabdariffa]
MSDLIDSHSATWKVDIMFDIFDEVQARKICSIPLFKAGLSDVVNWRPDGSGIYSVKSGYRLLCNDTSSSSAFIRECGSPISFAAVEPTTPRRRWSAPALNFVKCNFDSTFDVQCNESISGFLYRNSDGLIMAAGVVPHKNVADAFMAEALACLQAVLFAIELCFRRVVFEGESLAVVRRVSALSSDYFVTSPIVNDIRDAVKGLESAVFNFVHREGNNDAHVLAREGRGFRLPRFWIEEAPPCVTTAALDWEKLNAD